MIRKTYFFLVFYFVLYSCNQGNKKRIQIDLETNIKTTVDTVINRNGRYITDSAITRLFYESKYDSILIGSFQINDQRKIGIYLSSLLDNNNYEDASSLIQKIHPIAFYKQTANGVHIPVFKSPIDTFLLYSLLKYNQFWGGYGLQDLKDMFAENAPNFYITDTIVRKYFEIQYYLTEVLSSPKSSKSKMFLGLLKDDGIYLKNFKGFLKIIQFCKTLEDSSYEKLFYEYINDNDEYQQEFFFRILIENAIDEKINIPEKLIKKYKEKFPHTPSVFLLKYYQLNNKFDSTYIKECWNCKSKAKNLDSVKANVYLANYYLEYSKFDSLVECIKNYKKNNITYSIDTSPIKDGEYDIYSIFELRMYLKMEDFKSYIKCLGGLIRINILNFYPNGLHNEKNVRYVTHWLYSQNKGEENQFDSYYRKNIYPYISLSY
jgi:hypothetical protein